MRCIHQKAGTVMIFAAGSPDMHLCPKDTRRHAYSEGILFRRAFEVPGTDMAGHHHHHAGGLSEGRLKLSLLLTLGFVAIEAITGWRGGRRDRSVAQNRLVVT